jgi:hypothetical protein
MLRLVVALSLALGTLPFGTGCHTGKTPELRVLGASNATASHVFVQVTNPAKRPLRLTKLEYTFASTRDGATVARGEVSLAREIPAGAVAVVEVPFEAESSEVVTLRGKLTTELDQIVRTFKLDADIQPQ